MFELLEKAVLNALGAAAMTQKKGEEIMQELKARYRMSEEEGKQFLDRMQEIRKAGQEQATAMAETEVKKALERFGMVPREEFERLERRVRMLEAQQASADEEPGTEC